MNNSITSNFEKHGSYRYDIYQQNNTSLKAGKGYSKDTDPKGIPSGKPKGIQKGKCHNITKYQQTIHGKIPQICTGTIIAVKISTNQRGFETSTEQVCDTCGKVHATAFQVLNKEEPHYKTQYWNTHEEWLKDNKTSQILNEAPELGTDTYLENYAHLTGNNTNDTYYNENTTKTINPRLEEAINRLNNTNASKKMPMKDWRNNQYKLYAEDCKHRYNFTKQSLIDVKYYIDKYGLKYFYRRGLSYETIIYYMFVYLNNSELPIESPAIFLTIKRRIDHVNKL